MISDAHGKDIGVMRVIYTRCNNGVRSHVGCLHEDASCHTGEKRCGRDTEGKAVHILDRRVNIAIRFHADENQTQAHAREADGYESLGSTCHQGHAQAIIRGTLGTCHQSSHIAIRGGDHTDEAREHTQIGTQDETCSVSHTVRRVLRVQRISGEEDDQHDSPPHDVDHQIFVLLKQEDHRSRCDPGRKPIDFVDVDTITSGLHSEPDEEKGGKDQGDKPRNQHGKDTDEHLKMIVSHLIKANPRRTRVHDGWMRHSARHRGGHQLRRQEHGQHSRQSQAYGWSSNHRSKKARDTAWNIRTSFDSPGNR
mmetsp:Transcript_31791/g.84892  ORF Transcript_31791/g.84892 Transcript_31791/m.84892 type:complete len:309 (+) Transcript_31791:2055-2981(+)